MLVAFVLWQPASARRGDDPLMPLSLFRYANFGAANVANLAIGFALTGMFLPLIIYVQSVLGFSPLMSGVLTAPMSLLSGLVAPFAGKLSDRISGKYVAMTGFAAMAVGVAIITAQAGPDSNPWSLTPGLLVTGFGVGCVFSPLANLATAAVPLPQMGAASGVFNTFRQFGGVLGSAAVVVLLQGRLTVSMHAAAVSASTTLPPAFRDRFVAGMDASAASASNGAGAATAHVAGLPTQVAHELARLGTAAFHQGFTDAAKATLLLPVGVLVLGAVACLVMSRQRGATAPAGSAPTEHVDGPLLKEPA